MNKEQPKLLCYDTIFKSVFVREEKVLLQMIEDIFEIDSKEKPITIVGFETVPPKKDNKTYRGDLLVILSDNSYVMLEMNYRKERSLVERNMIQLIRVHNQVLKKGEADEKLKNYRIRGINFNNFPNESNEAVENYAFCNIKTGKIASLIYSICNISLEKCRELVYNINVRDLPKSVRWGAIMMEEDIEKIDKILGEDMLKEEEKNSFMRSIKEVKEEDRVLQDWMLEDNERWKIQGQMEVARDDGIIVGEMNKQMEIIQNMLREKVDYELISKVTGKTVEEIKDIEEKNKE